MFEALATEALEALAQDAATLAEAQGFTDFPGTLFFVLTMVRVHPLFYQVGSIARVIAQMKADDVVPSDRVATLVDEANPADWEAAGALGGYDKYYAAVFEAVP